MFGVENFLRLFNIIGYLSLFIGGCVGTSEIQSSYDNLTQIFVCVLSFSVVPIFIYFEYRNYFKKHIEYLSFMRSMFFVIFGILLIGISRITTVFGVLTIVIGLGNGICMIFKDNDNDNLLLDN